MKNIIKKRKKHLLIIFFFLLFSVAISSYAAQWYRSDPGGVIVVNEHGVCQRVNNQGSRSYFVPTNNAAEWSAFRSAVSSLDNVTLSGCECPLPWGGTISHGQSVTAYQSSSVACGSTCVSQTRTCNDGALSGSYQHQSCSVASCGGTWVLISSMVCAPCRFCTGGPLDGTICNNLGEITWCCTNNCGTGCGGSACFANIYECR